MPRKVTEESLNTKLARCNEQIEATEKKNAELMEKREKLIHQIKEKERARRTHNLCGLGGLVEKYFGKDITAEEFQGILNHLFAIDGVQKFVDAEKEKRFLRDNSPVSAGDIPEENTLSPAPLTNAMPENANNEGVFLKTDSDGTKTKIA